MIGEGATVLFQRGLYEALLADETIGELVNGNILDGNNGSEPPVPSIQIGEAEFSLDKYEGVTLIALAITLHTWRGDNGRLWPVRQLNFAIVNLLDERVIRMGDYGDATLTLDGPARDMLDADGLTGHGVLTFSTEIEDA